MATMTVYLKEHPILVTTPHGELTATQEVFAWRYAYHGVGMRAYRETFGKQSPGSLNASAIRLLKKDKVKFRIDELRKMHVNKGINLANGPWEHYRDEVKGIGKPDSDIRYASTHYENWLRELTKELNESGEENAGV